MRKDDLIRLRHMLAAANDALNFADEKPRDELDWNRMLALSVIKSVEIIGEAASKVAQDTRDLHPEIPWASIVAMRNRLIHGY